MAVYPDSIVDKFVVDDGHVANPISSFQVRGVYPSYFVASVCGETTCGDHVAFGVPGLRALTITAGFLVGDGHYVGGTGTQFGVPRPIFSAVVSGVPSAQSFGTPKLNVVRSAGGVPSAQQFGVPTPKATFLRSVGGVASAGAFGTVTALRLSSPQTVAVAAVASAQSFGVLTVKSLIARTVGSVPSVSAFGTVLFRVTAPTGGVPSAQAFGVPAPKAAITRMLTGLGTAQSFGTLVFKTPISRTVGGVSTAQAFGTVTTRVTAPAGGVPSAQSFGVPVAKGTISRTVTGPGSAQAFGVVTVKATIAPSVGSVPSAQAFGALGFKATITRALTGLGSAQQFGVPLMQSAGKTSVGSVPPAAAFGSLVAKPGAVLRQLAGLGTAQAFGTLAFRLSRPVGGVPSAQAFGVPTVASLAFPQTRAVSGVSSAQAFGAVQVRAPLQPGGVLSAQAFGVPAAFVVGAPPQSIPVPGVRGSSAYADSIVDQFKVDDGHVVNADSSSSYFGTPWAGHLWVLEAECIDSPLSAICDPGTICGTVVCGGASFVDGADCLGSPFPTIVNEFTCGQRLIGGVPFQVLSECLDMSLQGLEEVDGSFLNAFYETTIVDQFIVDDGHVVDGRDACLHSPLPAICDPGTICGTVVCGGASFISDLDCVDSATPAIVNTFLCGRLPVSGWSFNPPITVTRTIDLQPAGCL